MLIFSVCLFLFHVICSCFMFLDAGTPILDDSSSADDNNVVDEAILVTPSAVRTPTVSPPISLFTPLIARVSPPSSSTYRYSPLHYFTTNSTHGHVEVYRYSLVTRTKPKPPVSQTNLTPNAKKLKLVKNNSLVVAQQNENRPPTASFIPRPQTNLTFNAKQPKPKPVNKPTTFVVSILNAKPKPTTAVVSRFRTPDAKKLKLATKSVKNNSPVVAQQNENKPPTAAVSRLIPRLVSKPSPLSTQTKVTLNAKQPKPLNKLVVLDGNTKPKVLISKPTSTPAVVDVNTKPKVLISKRPAVVDGNTKPKVLISKPTSTPAVSALSLSTHNKVTSKGCIQRWRF